MARTTSIGGGRYAIGEYRDRVTIQAPSGEDWIDVAPGVWARVEAASALVAQHFPQVDGETDEDELPNPPRILR